MMWNNKGPLWMPEGSMRSIITGVMIGGTFALLFLKIDVPDVLWGLNGVILRDYFSMEREKKKEADDG